MPWRIRFLDEVDACGILEPTIHTQDEKHQKAVSSSISGWGVALPPQCSYLQSSKMMLMPLYQQGNRNGNRPLRAVTWIAWYDLTCHDIPDIMKVASFATKKQHYWNPFHQNSQLLNELLSNGPNWEGQAAKFNLNDWCDTTQHNLNGGKPHVLSSLHLNMLQLLSVLIMPPYSSTVFYPTLT